MVVIYTFSLVFAFPLLAIPLLVFVFLAFVAGRHMVEKVFVDAHSGPANAKLGLWLVARFGLLLSIQPFLYGLILLSRREWAISGASIAVGFITILLVSGFTWLRFPQPRFSDLPGPTRLAITKMRRTMCQPPPQAPNKHRLSDSSMLARIATLLPGYARLPALCPLPLVPEGWDDMVHTEEVSYIRPDLVAAYRLEQRIFHDPSESLRGLIYPPEMLAPRPVVWLERDEFGVAEAEAADLEKHHDLPSIVDPAVKAKDKGKERVY